MADDKSPPAADGKPAKSSSEGPVSPRGWTDVFDEGAPLATPATPTPAPVEPPKSKPAVAATPVAPSESSGVSPRGWTGTGLDLLGDGPEEITPAPSEPISVSEPPVPAKPAKPPASQKTPAPKRPVSPPSPTSPGSPLAGVKPATPPKKVPRQDSEAITAEVAAPTKTDVETARSAPTRQLRTADIKAKPPSGSGPVLPPAPTTGAHSVVDLTAAGAPRQKPKLPSAPGKATAAAPPPVDETRETIPRPPAEEARAAPAPPVEVDETRETIPRPVDMNTGKATPSPSPSPATADADADPQAEEIEAEAEVAALPPPRAKLPPPPSGSSRKDFRDPKAATSAQTPSGSNIPAVAPPTGVKPPMPGAPDLASRNDTQALIASVAGELISQAEAERRAREKAAQEAAAAAAAASGGAGLDAAVGRSAAAGAVVAAGMFGVAWKEWVPTAVVGVLGTALILWSLFDRPPQIPASEVSTAAAVASEEDDDDDAKGEPSGEQEAEGDDENNGEEEAAPADDDAAQVEAEGPPAEPEPEPEPEPAAQQEPEPEPAPARKTSPSSGSKKSSGSKSAAKPAPAPEKKPAASQKPAPAPQSASELLREAKKALARGQANTAYSLAQKSYQKRPAGETAEVMTRAACQMRSTSKARSAFKKTRLLQRRTIKSECKRHGVSL